MPYNVTHLEICAITFWHLEICAITFLHPEIMKRDHEIHEMSIFKFGLLVTAEVTQCLWTNFR